MKEFSEWQVEQQTDHARSVCHSDELETITIQEERADGEHQACDGNCKEQEQRKHIIGKRLGGELATVSDTQLDGEGEAHEHQNGGDVQQIEVQESKGAMNGKLFHLKSE